MRADGPKSSDHAVRPAATLAARPGSTTRRTEQPRAVPSDLSPKDIRRVQPQPNLDPAHFDLSIVLVKVRSHAILIGPELRDHVRSELSDRVVVVELGVARPKREESPQSRWDSCGLAGDMRVRFSA